MRGLQRRVTRLERSRPTHHALLQWAAIPIEKWPEPVVTEFSNVMRESTAAGPLLRALSQENLEWLIEALQAADASPPAHDCPDQGDDTRMPGTVC